MCVCVVLRHLVVSARVDINRVYIRGHLVDDDDGGVTHSRTSCIMNLETTKLI